MIIFGIREARLLTTVFEDKLCPQCGQEGSVACTVFSKHAHVFWIPFFPIGKRGLIWCTQCGHTFKHASEVEPTLQKQITDFKQSQKAPFWQWTGLLLMIGIMVYAMISGFLETRNTKLFIESPQVNDVYCVKYDDKAYTLMSIYSIENDSIFFIENKYTMSLESKAKQLHRNAFYDHDYIYGYSHDELKELFYEDKRILTIWRNLPYQTKQLKLTDKERKLLEEEDDAEMTERMYENREAQLDELRNLDEMTFENPELNEQIAKYQELYKRFEESVEKKDENNIAACEADYTIWYTETGEIVKKLSMEEIAEFAPYSAKLSILWGDLRMKSQE